jgi:hypothetical protein
MSIGIRTYSMLQAARRLGITASRAQQLVKDGRLVPFRRDPMLFDDEAIEACKRVWPNPVGRPVGYVPPPGAKHGGGRPRKTISE